VHSAKPKHPNELLQSERVLPGGAENMPFEKPIPVIRTASEICHW